MLLRCHIKIAGLSVLAVAALAIFARRQLELYGISRGFPHSGSGAEPVF
jgi:hypothetical protein